MIEIIQEGAFEPSNRGPKTIDAARQGPAARRRRGGYSSKGETAVRYRTEQFIVRMTKGEKKQLEKLARQRGLFMGELLTQLVSEALLREKP